MSHSKLVVPAGTVTTTASNAELSLRQMLRSREVYVTMNPQEFEVVGHKGRAAARVLLRSIDVWQQHHHLQNHLPFRQADYFSRWLVKLPEDGVFIKFGHLVKDGME